MVCQFVSAFDPHPNRPSGSQESGSSRSFQPLVKAPQLGRGAGIQPSASSSTSKSVPARKKGSIRAREREEPIVTDLVSSPRFSADDALVWEPSDSEVELVSETYISRRKATTSKAGLQNSERGTKRKREIIGKADETDLAESEASQPSSMWADKYAPTTIVGRARFLCVQYSQTNKVSRARQIWHLPRRGSVRSNHGWKKRYMDVRQDWMSG
jgi:hypothetical protein